MKNYLLALLSVCLSISLGAQTTVYWHGTDSVRISLGQHELFFAPNTEHAVSLAANERLTVRVKNRYGTFQATGNLLITDNKGSLDVELKGLDVLLKYKPDKNTNPVLEAIANNMLLVQGGTYYMGNNEGPPKERPVHRVRLKNFYISKYEVTNEQWRSVMGHDTAYFRTCTDCPVENITWDNAQRFINRLNELTGKHYRLPTEAEWEYAARGGSESAANQFSGSNTLDDVAWFTANSEKKTHAVGTKMPNELGLYDMSGNVWEWCSDWFGENYYSLPSLENPKGPASGEVHVLRGGSWFDFDIECRNTNRFIPAAGYRLYIIGFRLAMDAE